MARTLSDATSTRRAYAALGVGTLVLVLGAGTWMGRGPARAWRRA